MSSRTVRRICLLGLLDVGYRLFLRGYVRRQVGMEIPAKLAAPLSAPSRGRLLADGARRLAAR